MGRRIGHAGDDAALNTHFAGTDSRLLDPDFLTAHLLWLLFESGLLAPLLDSENTRRLPVSGNPTGN